jgi:hypothetical protein
MAYKMKIVTISKTIRMLTVILLVCGLYACVDDREEFGPDGPLGGKATEFVFSVSLPAQARTYALGTADENNVSRIDVLAFKYDGSQYLLADWTQAIAGSIQDNGSSSSKKFTVKFTRLVQGDSYKFVILANAKQEVENLFAGGTTVGAEKNATLAQLKLSGVARWNMDTSDSGYRDIPMWGETPSQDGSGDKTISPNMQVTGLALLRMVARINLTIDGAGTPPATGDFKLRSVSLYNTHQSAQVVPALANLVSGSTSQVKLPTLVSGSNTVKGPVLYDASVTACDISDEALVNNIYTFESAVARDGSNNPITEQTTCLVVGGLYGSDTQPTYYRLDLVKKDGAGNVTYLDILRNHSYNVKITKVKGRGYDTPEEAFKSKAVNIEAEVVVWNDAQISDVVFDGQHMLGVSKGEFSFSREQRTVSSDDNILSVTTDYPTGWTVEKIIDASDNDISSVTNPSTGWLSLSPNSGASGSTVDTKLILTENTSGGTRTGFIHLKAGRLAYVVKVNQLATAHIGISIADVATGSAIGILEYASTLQDVSGGILPVPQQFKLKWSPVSSNLFFASTAINNDFIFASGAGLDNIPASGSINDPAGSKVYTIQPTAITAANLASNPFYERLSILLYTITNGVETVNKTLTLRQFVYNMVPVVEPVYVMDGTRKSFGVRSNTPFTVSVQSNPNNVITLRTTSGVPSTGASGTPVYFDIIDDVTNPTIYQQDVVLTISSPANLFPETTLTLNCASGELRDKANSYIMSPNGAGILIPVGRSNESMLGSQLGISESFSAELLWTDNANGVASNSNIRMVRTIGTGSSGYVLVMPGTQDGNAVVVIRNSSNKILWSWHIWVTPYLPSPVGTSKLMDRNLGATSNAKGDVRARGLMYQWGRKDAFPAYPELTIISGIDEPTLYTASGSTISVTNTQHSNSSNFANSVANPLTFYYGQSSRDWYTNNATPDATQTALWGQGSSKSVYDPCPSGWRVPQGTVWSGISSSDFPVGVTGDYGRTTNNAAYIGFYPYTGTRSATSGQYQNVGMSGYYRTADYQRSLTFSNGGGAPDAGHNGLRALAGAVRCVRDE